MVDLFGFCCFGIGLRSRVSMGEYVRIMLRVQKIENNVVVYYFRYIENLFHVAFHCIHHLPGVQYMCMCRYISRSPMLRANG